MSMTKFLCFIGVHHWFGWTDCNGGAYYERLCPACGKLERVIHKPAYRYMDGVKVGAAAEAVKQDWLITRNPHAKPGGSANPSR